jgi:hypothetical protein
MMELLLCLGQALWETSEAGDSFLKLLAEIEAGVPGEIDEESLREKFMLFSSRASARSRIRLERYARASFAGTVVEYIFIVHGMVLPRGAAREHSPAPRRRPELLARWSPGSRPIACFRAPMMGCGSGWRLVCQ